MTAVSQGVLDVQRLPDRRAGDVWTLAVFTLLWSLGHARAEAPSIPARLPQTFAADLASADREVRRRALFVFGRLKVTPATEAALKAATPQVVKTVNDPDPLVRRSAVWALSGKVSLLTDKRVRDLVTPALAGALTDPDEKVQSAALQAFRLAAQDSDVCKLLVPQFLTLARFLVRSPAIAAKLDVATTLGFIAARTPDTKLLQQAARLLVKACEDPDPAPAVAAYALTRITWDVRDRRRAVLAPLLLELLRHPNPCVRKTAREQLGLMIDAPGDPHALLPALIPLAEGLADPDDESRRAADSALRKVAPLVRDEELIRSAYPALEASLRTGDEEARRAAGRTLDTLFANAESEDLREEMLRVFVSALADSHGDVRALVAGAIGRAGDKVPVNALLSSVGPGLLALLSDSDPTAAERAAKSLGQWLKRATDPATLTKFTARLDALLQEGTPAQQVAAAQALIPTAARRGDADTLRAAARVCSDGLDAALPGVRRLAAAAAGTLATEATDESLVKPLVLPLGSLLTDPAAGWNAAEALAAAVRRIHDPMALRDSVRPLTGVIERGGPTRSAFAALMVIADRLSDEETLQPILSAVTYALKKGEYRTSAPEAAETLVIVAPKITDARSLAAALAALVPLLNSKTGAVRVAAAYAAVVVGRRCGDQRKVRFAMNVLRRARRHWDPEVRSAAAAHLRELSP